MNEWLDRNMGRVFLAPAVTLILIFSIFPLVASLLLSFTRVRLSGGGFKIRFAGLKNFEKQFFGSEQFHLIGTFSEISVLGWIVGFVFTVVLLWWIFNYVRSHFTWVGFIGRMITFALALGLCWLFSATLLSGNPFGTIGVTLFYVFVGCGIQFLVGTALAFACSQRIMGANAFRVVFFVPMMITPIGVGYIFRMMADTTKGPFAGVWQWIGLGEFSWATDPWAARIFIVVADSWQWIPFVFIMMLAAFESVPRDLTEAAELDCAGPWQKFREIIWPHVLPIAATVMLIRAIEAFKVVDLPNIMTSGGPGIATESVSLQAYYAWRSLDLGAASAIAYILLFVTVVTCASFFNLVVLSRVRKQQ
ncbi:MAG: sugar ABC transporter permease [Rhodobacteraceae bacterium]|nr:sugar ABC transporter permease [Paracoccaceae bacterium]